MWQQGWNCPSELSRKYWEKQISELLLSKNEVKSTNHSQRDDTRTRTRALIPRYAPDEIRGWT